MSDDRTCKTCRHHSKIMRPRPIQPVVSSSADYVGVAFSDVDEPLYTCRAPRGENAPHAGKEIGFDPVTCAAHELGKRIDGTGAAALDEAVARVELRLAARMAARRATGDD